MGLERPAGGDRSGELEAGAEHDVLLVESDRVSQLPGMWTKRVTVAADQVGFVTSKGTVVKELGSGTTTVGMSFLGLAGRSKEVLRFRFRPFQLRLNLDKLGVNCQAGSTIELTALIVTPSLLYSSVLNYPGRLYASQLASVIIGAVEGSVKSVLARTPLDEAGFIEGLLSELDMPLRRAMAERGLQVERVSQVD